MVLLWTRSRGQKTNFKMALTPKEIKSQQGHLTILWNDDHASTYEARDLRLACRCAACVDEWTHENLIKADKIPGSIKPTKIEVVGNYALHFTWSDGHSTGIYTYEYLRGLCHCQACR